MRSFKLAAIKILRDAQAPLHYDEIIKHALEQNLKETSGATSEATMRAQINVDIKSKKENSTSIRAKLGYFTLNPRYTKEEQKKDETEEITKGELEPVSTQYIGKAGKHLVVSELLFRAFKLEIAQIVF